ncbi:MAG TPA: glycerophosphodiester phosphodiesterase [Burkholderiales bacterium]|nr:glycerophosphodiester phosphodiesterase [Burkholderiales bacterium]
MPTQSLDLQGHRGARGLMPENTLPGFSKALAIGVNTLELDCVITRDDVVVVCHDRQLNPDLARRNLEWVVAPGPVIRSLSYEELCEYEVGRIKPDTAYAERFPAQAPLDRVKIPRLSEVFALVKSLGADDVRFSIETKLHPLRPEQSPAPQAFAEMLLKEIDAAGMIDRTSVQSFDWRTLAVMQQLAPQIPTVYLSVQQSGEDTIGTASKTGSPWTNRIRYAEHGSVPRMVQAAAGKIWSPHQADVNAENVAEAHALGLGVVVWTVNDAAGIENMIDLGVDGIISDYPNRLRKVAESKGLPLPRVYGAA